MLKVYAITHKEYQFAKERTVIGVGANRSIEGVSLYDNAGENIADKNKSFCELTALYWIWKNTNDEYVGFEHYRRFFAKENFFSYREMTIKEMESILKKYDAILPIKNGIKGTTLYEQYAQAHYQSDMDICAEIIKEKYPEYYVDYKQALNVREGCRANVFVMSKKLMDEYCEWIFTILFEAEKRIDYSERDAYQQRVFGFLSERLFNVWLHHKKLKIKYLPIHDFNEGGKCLNLYRRGVRKLKRILTGKRKDNK